MAQHKAMAEPDDLSLLPENPSPEELLTAYKLCRQKLVAANRSRSSLAGHNTRRYKAIRDLQLQLSELEESFQSEVASRIRVHELNARVAEIVRELETGIDQTAEIISEPSTGRLSDWVTRIAGLLKVVLRLHRLRSKASQLLGRRTEPEPLVLTPQRPNKQQQADETQSLLDIESEDAEKPVVDQKALPDLPVGPVDIVLDHTAYGPLVLQYVDGAYCLLVLHGEGHDVPNGLFATEDPDWLAGVKILVPEEPESEDYAPVEAGILIVDSEESTLQVLQDWMNAGLLPFRRDPKLGVLRLLPLSRKELPSHLLVRKEAASLFEEAGTKRIVLEFDQHNWVGFVVDTTDDRGLFLELLQNKNPRGYGPRLSTRGGVLLPDRQYFLASGLGLPHLGVPAQFDAKQVQLILADGSVLGYVKERGTDQSESRTLWRPSAQDRRLLELLPGEAKFTASFEGQEPLSRSIKLGRLAEESEYKRSRPIDQREDWGMKLGPIALGSSNSAAVTISAAALVWAQNRLRSADLNVNSDFEQQMLEALSAVFQRRPSIKRQEFFELYAQLRNKPDEWPRFTDAVLRGWCEGGWLEEGVERGHGAWRIQPVDPRFVRLPGGGLQLVGLVSSRKLVRVIATAYHLGSRVQTVQPSCADMPRGWRFFGVDEVLADACGLPAVALDAWVADPSTHDWSIHSPLPCDSPSWPLGTKNTIRNDSVCGRRGPDYHWKPSPPLPEGGRAPIHLKIDLETSRYGCRRWYSRDPNRDLVFTTCHRNRAALHALFVATKGLWPFGFTDLTTGQLDRLYDAEAYLPLPLARYTALTGSKMPGPTRLRPEDHTYRYSVHRELRIMQSQAKFLPLTSLT